jgi:hypothetical protein
LVEIEWTAPPPADWPSLLTRAGISDIVPHGLYHHALVQNPGAWKKFLSHTPTLQTRTIAPSLEDVFIRLVENRTL